jgi:hypothetical protein
MNKFFKSIFMKENLAVKDYGPKPCKEDILGRLVYCLKPVHAALPTFDRRDILSHKTRQALITEVNNLVSDGLVRDINDLWIDVNIEPDFIYVACQDNFTGGQATRCWMAKG